MSIHALFIEHKIGDTFTVLDENFNKVKVIATPDKNGEGCSNCVLHGALCPHLLCADGVGHHYELLQDSSQEPLNNSTL